MKNMTTSEPFQLNFNKYLKTKITGIKNKLRLEQLPSLIIDERGQRHNTAELMVLIELTEEYLRYLKYKLPLVAKEHKESRRRQYQIIKSGLKKE